MWVFDNTTQGLYVDEDEDDHFSVVRVYLTKEEAQEESGEILE
jgi:hypothetical protein